MPEASVLTNNFELMAVILNSVSVLLGLSLTFGAFMALKKHGEQRTMMSGQGTLAGPLVMLVCGAILMILPKFTSAILLAFWGHRSDMSYTGGATGYSELVPPILIFVRVIGLGSFIRGVFMLSRTGGQQHQPGQIGKALMHIVAGVLCMHVMDTIDLLQDILGL